MLKCSSSQEKIKEFKKMKPFTVIVSVFLAFAISNSHAASLHRIRRQVVPKEFANINIENYLKNERAVAFQLKCIVYDGPCDRIGKYLKVTIPELLTNQCQNCDPGQRQRAGRLVQHIQQKFPKEWSDAVQKFQGGQVRKEDADRLESLLGVKLDSKLVAAATTTTTTTTSAPSTTTTTSTTVAPVVVLVASSTVGAPVEVSSSTSTTAAPLVASNSTTTGAPVEAVSSSVAPEVSSSPVPLVSVALASSTAAPEVTSSAAPVSSSSVPEVSSTTLAASSSSTEASSTIVADISTSTSANVVSSSPVTIV